MKLVSHMIDVDTIFASTWDYCLPYLAEGDAALSVAITLEDIAVERQKAAREDVLEGLPIRNLSDSQLEITALQRKIAEEFFSRNILLFHGSVIAVDNTAYLFTAKSGTGKSTHTRLWREVFGDRAVMVNDDKPFLRFTESGVLACGAPWSGKHGLDTNITVPLQGICILDRGKENQIEKITREEALPMLLHQTYCPMEPAKHAHFEALVKQLAEKTPLWHMYCNMDFAAAEVSHSAMSKA